MSKHNATVLPLLVFAVLALVAVPEPAAAHGRGALFSPAAAPLEIGDAPTSLAVLETEDGFDDLFAATAGAQRIEEIDNHFGRLSRFSAVRVGIPAAALAISEPESHGLNSVLVAGAGTARLFDLRFNREGRASFDPVGGPVGIGSDPAAVLDSEVPIEWESPDGKAEREPGAEFVVADRGSDDLSLLGRQGGRVGVVATIPVGDAPAALAGRGGAYDTIWVANSGSGTVTALRGGIFNGKVYSEAIPVGGEPVALAIGDFVGGDHQDEEAAVVDGRSGRVEIVDRPKQVVPHPFEPYRVVASYAAGRRPVAIVATDLDERQGTDLAVLDAGARRVRILLSRGGGRFVDGGAYPAGRRPAAIAPIEYGPRFGEDLAIADRGADRLRFLVHDQFGRCGRHEARLRVGTPRRDFFGGTDDPEELRGLGGDDRLAASGGDDCIRGEGGDDYVLGFDGDDRLWGGPGRDELNGGTGNDTIYARDGERDVVRCGENLIHEHDLDTVYADRVDSLHECERRVVRGAGR